MCFATSIALYNVNVLYISPVVIFFNWKVWIYSPCCWLHLLAKPIHRKSEFDPLSILNSEQILKIRELIFLTSLAAHFGKVGSSTLQRWQNDCGNLEQVHSFFKAGKRIAQKERFTPWSSLKKQTGSLISLFCIWLNAYVTFICNLVVGCPRFDPVL